MCVCGIFVFVYTGAVVQKSKEDICVFYCSLPCSLETGFPTEPGTHHFHRNGWPARSRGPLIFTALGFRAHMATLSFDRSAGDLNSNFYAYAANTLVHWVISLEPQVLVYISNLTRTDTWSWRCGSVLSPLPSTKRPWVQSLHIAKNPEMQS